MRCSGVALLCAQQNTGTTICSIASVNSPAFFLTLDFKNIKISIKVQVYNIDGNSYNNDN